MLTLFYIVADSRDKSDKEKTCVNSQSFHVCCLRFTEERQEEVERCRINQQYAVVIFKLSAQQRLKGFDARQSNVMVPKDLLPSLNVLSISDDSSLLIRTQ